jgi:acetyltransferase-like isoleucine patch superfamily enzyme
VPDDVDICPGGDDNQNADGDSLPDFCDVCPLDAENDVDGDGICGDIDNCPSVPNPEQTDLNGDEFGDDCVHPNASINDDADIAADVIIGSGAQINKDVTVESGAVIGENVVLNRDRLV